jgi:hypothetical protein
MVLLLNLNSHAASSAANLSRVSTCLARVIFPIRPSKMISAVIHGDIASSLRYKQSDPWVRRVLHQVHTQLNTSPKFSSLSFGILFGLGRLEAVSPRLSRRAGSCAFTYAAIS